MKKIIALLTVCISLMTISAPALADGVSVHINGRLLECPVAPYIEDGRTLVPMRALFEAVGASVYWDQEMVTVIASRLKNDKYRVISLQVNSTKAYVDNELVEIDVPAKVVGEGTTMVPLRFVVEALGEKVEWDETTQTVSIITE